MKTQKYKLRAECAKDVCDFLGTIHGMLHTFSMTRIEEMPDCEVEFETSLDIVFLTRVLKSIPDGHVMQETLYYAEKYTGERAYKYVSVNPRS